MASNADSTKNKVNCPVCGFENRPGSLVCENCGSLLNAMAASRRAATRDLRGHSAPGEPTADEIDDHKKIRGAEYQEGMVIRLDIEGAKKPIMISPDTLKNVVIMGRRDPITEQSPPVDLDEYAGYRMGVSRKHAIMELINGKLTVSDLGSSNGTFINGRRLPMRQPQELLEGDSLRLGQIIINVKFVKME